MASFATSPFDFSKLSAPSQTTPAKKKTPDFDAWLRKVTPTYHWEWDYLAYIRQQLARVTSGEIDRLMLFLPPRHGKTEMVTIRYPVWRLEDDPECRVIIGAYNQMLANKFSRKARRIARERIDMSQERDAVEDWETGKGGGMRAVGVGGGITGQGGNLVIIDDPVKSREEADSATYRDRCWDWYTDDLYTRLEPGASVILIMTRWHADDLAGRILQSEEGKKWTVIDLPAIALDDDPLSRAVGAPLCPARFDLPELARIKTVLGSRSWSALYQQRPYSDEGALFKRGWFSTVAAAPPGLRWVRYWDLAVDTKKTNDRTASARCAFDRDGTLYIGDVAKGRWEWPDVQALVKSYTDLDGRSCLIGVEEAGQQKGFIQYLRRDPALRGVAIYGVPVHKDKQIRAAPWQSRAEAGKVKLVLGPWNAAFLDEVCSFPVGEHDDQVDAVSGCVQMLGSTGPMFRMATSSIG